MKKFNVYETDEELEKRLDVLRRINAMVKAWVKRVSVEKNASFIFLSLTCYKELFLASS